MLVGEVARSGDRRAHKKAAMVSRRLFFDAASGFQIAWSSARATPSSAGDTLASMTNTGICAR